jgi:hypothetical protein
MPPLWNINSKFDAQKYIYIASSRNPRKTVVTKLLTPDRARRKNTLSLHTIVIYLAPPNLDVSTLNDVGSRNGGRKSHVDFKFTNLEPLTIMGILIELD